MKLRLCVLCRRHCVSRHCEMSCRLIQLVGPPAVLMLQRLCCRRNETVLSAGRSRGESRASCAIYLHRTTLLMNSTLCRISLTLADAMVVLRSPSYRTDEAENFTASMFWVTEVTGSSINILRFNTDFRSALLCNMLQICSTDINHWEHIKFKKRKEWKNKKNEKR